MAPGEVRKQALEETKRLHTVLCSADKQHCHGGRILLGILEVTLLSPSPLSGPLQLPVVSHTELLTCLAFYLLPKVHTAPQSATTPSVS